MPSRWTGRARSASVSVIYSSSSAKSTCRVSTCCVPVVAIQQGVTIRVWHVCGQGTTIGLTVHTGKARNPRSRHSNSAQQRSWSIQMTQQD